MASDRITLSAIPEFWNWFAKNCHDFGNTFSNKALIEELDRRVFAMGDFSWEIGPGVKAENLLVISAGGNIKLTAVAKAIIADAVPCKDWEYYYFKPPKKWDFKVNFQGEEPIRLDVSEWTYVLFKCKDDTLAIIIRAPELIDMAETDQLTAVEIVLDSVVGEEIRVEKITSFEVVDEFANFHADGANKITVLADHLKSVL